MSNEEDSFSSAIGFSAFPEVNHMYRLFPWDFADDALSHVVSRHCLDRFMDLVYPWAGWFGRKVWSGRTLRCP